MAWEKSWLLPFPDPHSLHGSLQPSAAWSLGVWLLDHYFLLCVQFLNELHAFLVFALLNQSGGFIKGLDNFRTSVDKIHIHHDILSDNATISRLLLLLYLNPCWHLLLLLLLLELLLVRIYHTWELIGVHHLLLKFGLPSLKRHHIWIHLVHLRSHHTWGSKHYIRI